MVTAFVDMAGLLMVIPLLPFYAKSMGAGGLVVGALILVPRLRPEMVAEPATT